MNETAGTGKRSATARAHANFALVKYWGKRDAGLNLPASGSVSLTLEALSTRTQVEFDPALESDRVIIDGSEEAAPAARVSRCLDLLRDIAGVGWPATVDSASNFPSGAGLASSASAFAALVVAADAALGLKLDPARLSELARRGSGSAARSIFGGFVEMARGERADGRDAVARPLLAAGEWPLEVVVAITDRATKSAGSTEGMTHTARTSPYYPAWLDDQAPDLDKAHRAILARDFEQLAAIGEGSALKMHAAALAARPGLIYWNGATVECLHRVRALRAGGVGVFFTVDAGPQVKAVCLPGQAAAVVEALAGITGVEETIVSGLGPGAAVLEHGDGA